MNNCTVTCLECIDTSSNIVTLKHSRIAQGMLVTFLPQLDIQSNTVHHHKLPVRNDLLVDKDTVH